MVMILRVLNAVWQHLQMTPFRTLLENKTPGHLASEVLRLIFDEGFEVVLRHWLQ